MFSEFEPLFLRIPYGLSSRLRIVLFRLLGMSLGTKNRIETGRCRRLNQIAIGSNNAFTQGFFLWPEDSQSNNKRIIIGNHNYFNRNLMIDACENIIIGDMNMFGPDVYITDSNHKFGNGISPSKQPMHKGKVKIGNHCWIGAKVIILKDVELGDYCVVAAGSIVTKSFPSRSLVAGVPAKLIRLV